MSIVRIGLSDGGKGDGIDMAPYRNLVHNVNYYNVYQVNQDLNSLKVYYRGGQTFLLAGQI